MFSKSTEYALRATIYIAQQSTKENKIGIAEVAHAIDSPNLSPLKFYNCLQKTIKSFVQ